MSEKSINFNDQNEVLSIQGRSTFKRLPGRDVPISDDEDDDGNVEDLSIEIIDEKRGPVPRKSSLMVNPIGKNQERKRSVTFEAADVASLHQPEVKDDESSLLTATKSMPIPIANLRLRVSDDIPDSPPPRPGEVCLEALPPTPPGASHRVKIPRTPPPTPIDTNYL